MTDQELMQAAKKLIDSGVQLDAIYEPIGCLFSLRASDVVPFTRDRDAFFAGECGLEKSEYVAWKLFMATGRTCSATGTRGPCRRPAKDSHSLSPQEHARRVKEGTLLCAAHMKSPAGRPAQKAD